MQQEWTDFREQNRPPVLTEGRNNDFREQIPAFLHTGSRQL